MNTRAAIMTRDSCNLSLQRREAAFTMVEIAISLGVIAFALVAIIGILPTGLQTQRDNREDTLVNQDARLLIEAIKSGGRDVTSDIGAYVLMTNGVAVPPNYHTTNLVQLLCDTSRTNTAVLSSITGALASRGSDLAFKYEVRSVVLPSNLGGSAWADTAYEVRLRFAWPVPPSGKINPSANTYVVRALLTGYRDPANGFIYAQEYRR